MSESALPGFEVEDLEDVKVEPAPATIRVLPVLAMPDPKDKKAPHFKGDDVHDFVESLELLARACGIDETDLASHVLRYCSRDVKAVLVDEHVFSGHDWQAARRRLITLYESQTKKYKPTVEKLRRYVSEEQKKPSIRSLESLDTYRNEFAKRAGGLVKKKEMSQVERDLLFFQGMPEDVRLAITPTLQEGRKKQGKKLSRTDPPTIEEAWRAAHDYFDTDDINRIARKSKRSADLESDSDSDSGSSTGTETSDEDSTDSGSDTDSSSDRKRKKGKGKKKKSSSKKHKKGSKKGKTKKTGDVDDKIQQLTDRLQGLTSLIEQGVQSQRFVSVPPPPPLNNPQVPFFQTQQPMGSGGSYSTAVGTSDRKCYMCGKVEGVDLDHRFGFKACPETEKLIRDKILMYSAIDGKLMRTDSVPLPQFNNLGQGGLAAYLRRETAQKGWQRDPPPHQAGCMSLGLCRNDEPVFSYDKSTGPTVYDAYSFPAVTRAKSKTQTREPRDEEPAAPKIVEHDKPGQKSAYVPHVSNTEEGRRAAQQEKRRVRFEEIQEDDKKEKGKEQKVNPGTKAVPFRFTSDLQESVAVENLQDQILSTKVTLTLREVLAMSPQLQKRLQTLTRTRREFDTRTGDVGSSSDQSIRVLPANEPGAASVTFATGEDLEDLVIRYADAVVLGNARLFAMASGMVQGVFGDQKVKFLVDSGSELNLISRATWEKAKMSVDRDGSRWSLRGLGGENVPLIGCCRDAPVQLGGKNFDHHFFVSEVERPQYDGILGQPWLAWYSASIQYTRGGPVFLVAYPSGSREGAFARRSLRTLTIHRIFDGGGAAIQLAPPSQFDHLLRLVEYSVPLSRFPFRTAWVSRALSTEALARDSMAGRRYKPVARKAFKPIPLPTPPPLPTNPPRRDDLQYTARLSRERLDLILSAVPDRFLSEAELDLLASVLVERQAAIAFNDSEREHIPWVRPPIPIPKAIVGKVRDLLREQTLAGKYEQSCAAYWSPVFTVLKKNGSLRLVHDLQDLNSVTIRDAALPPRPDDFAEGFVGHTVYGVADLFSGYDARTLDPRSRDLTTFQCMEVSARNTVLPQGATNAVTDFGRCTYHTLRDEPNAEAFVDDCGIKGPKSRYEDATLDDNPKIRKFIYEYATTFDRVFRRFELAGLTASGTKLVLAAPQVQIVGSVVSHEGWHLVHGIVSKVLKWKYPESLTEVRSFLGIAGVGRRWIEGFSLIARPLTSLCRQPPDIFVLTDAARAAVDELKARITAAPILKAIDYELAKEIRPPFPFPSDGLVVVGVDSSIYGAGWVLYQYHGKERHPALYGSCTFTAAESRYSQPKVELYGVFRALKELRGRVWGVHFLLEVDAKFLEKMIKEPDLPNAPMTRWVVYLQLFDFTLRHIPAEKGKAQDALSRRPPSSDDSEESDGEAHLDEILGNAARRHVAPLSSELSSPSVLFAFVHDAMISSGYAFGRDSSANSNDLRLLSGVSVVHLGDFAFIDPEYYDRYPAPATCLRTTATEPSFFRGRSQAQVLEYDDHIRLGNEVINLPFRTRRLEQTDEFSNTSDLCAIEIAIIAEGDVPGMDTGDLLWPVPHGKNIEPVLINAGRATWDVDRVWEDIACYLRSGSFSSKAAQESNEEQRRLKRLAQGFFLYDDRLWRDRRGKTPVLVVVSEGRRMGLVASAHNTTGHRGRDATFKILQERYYWPNMYDDVDWFVASCNACQFLSKKRALVPISPTSSPSVFRRFVCDTVHMPGGTFLLHASCATSKWPEARFAKKNNSKVWARFIYEDIICRFGCTPLLVCDGGAEFKGAVEEILVRYNIPVVLSSPYHPEGNGIAERDGQTLVNAILRSCAGKTHDWHKYLHAGLLAVRTTTSRSTGFTPYFLTYGMHCLFPFDIADRTWHVLDWDKVSSTEDLLECRIKQLARREQDIGQAVEHQYQSRLRAVDDYMRRNAHRLRLAEYEPGTWVLVHETWLDAQHGHKGALRWAGPYVVFKRDESGSYLLRELDGTLMRSRVAGNRLKIFYFRETLQTLRSSFTATLADAYAPARLHEPSYEFTCNLIHHERTPQTLGLTHRNDRAPTVSELVDAEGCMLLGGWRYEDAGDAREVPVTFKVETNLLELLALRSNIQ
ncbi:hypothetical protein ONZ51_g12825 [Trametes cubensis]|uniref:RNA-directed DNA polymerase n=1 Tax=Trametes cubensis TaxID=1111947 RepID=A0AAD7X4K6_9APHY|nr:hypothetical protein ONZ51_g12825 [Trametes cubensis]